MESNSGLHVAIIPDGNRRWAKLKGMITKEGYSKSGSYENLKKLFDEARKMGVKYFSIWGFSTENWKRDKGEIDYVMNLIFRGLKKFREEVSKEEIRFRHVGKKDRLPKEIVNEIEKLEKESAHYKDFTVQLCLDYGGRDEIIRAVNKIIKDGKRKVDEKSFASYLDTPEVPDPDLIIRTGEERRLSGFMPYQGAYAELYFSEKHFPDFGPKELREAVNEFSRRARRFGGN
ncbi:MAG: polyprenyl diphosphate synthase [Nanoarchaeota archaeon]